jgi:hypothetical protein
MGRFDALTQLNQPPVHQSPASLRDDTHVSTAQQERNPENPKAGKPETLKRTQPENPKSGFPESSISGKPETLKTRLPDTIPFVKAEKYSTQLQLSIIKQIKQYALEHDMKDYEVVQAAIRDYLARKR